MTAPRLRSLGPGRFWPARATDSSHALLPGVAEVLALLPSFTVLVDSDDQVVQASPSAYDLGLVRGSDVTPDSVRSMIHTVRRSGEVTEAELEIPRGPLGKETLSVHVRAAPLQDLILVLVDDRTQARRIEEVRRDFVANVSHELKTPVGALGLLAEAVGQAAEDPAAVRRFAERMQYESGRLSNLVQELIDLSRLQGHDPLPAARDVSLAEVAGDAAELNSLSAGVRGIEIVVNATPDLVVLGEKGQLVTAVRNLVHNAVAYSPDNTTVHVVLRRSGDLAEIAIVDEGRGIPLSDIDRIFERFYRVDPARSRVTGGTGLGLSIVKHIIGNHGGEVTVSSIEGQGSTFTVRLPLRRVPRVPVEGEGST